MAFQRHVPGPGGWSDDIVKGSEPPPALNAEAVAARQRRAEQEDVRREMLFSRKRRLERLQKWRQDVARAKAAGYVSYPYDAPLTFPEPLAGMRRDPHTGNLMSDQPRLYGI